MDVADATETNIDEVFETTIDIFPRIMTILNWKDLGVIYSAFEEDLLLCIDGVQAMIDEKPGLDDDTKASITKCISSARFLIDSSRMAGPATCTDEFAELFKNRSYLKMLIDRDESLMDIDADAFNIIKFRKIYPHLDMEERAYLWSKLTEWYALTRMAIIDDVDNRIKTIKDTVYNGVVAQITMSDEDFEAVCDDGDGAVEDMLEGVTGRGARKGPEWQSCGKGESERERKMREMLEKHTI